MSLADYACADEPAHVFAYHADALAFLRALPDEWTHCIITDPPYGLADHKPEVVAQAITAWATGDRERVPSGKGFMGREWDAFVPPPAVWDECLRVLKPGGHLAVFAGSRTVDLMGLSIRLAGFEMRDGIAAWLYGQGFSKGRNISADPTFCQCSTGAAVPYSHADGEGDLRRVRTSVRDVAPDAASSEVANMLSTVQREGARAGVGDARPQGSGGMEPGDADPVRGECSGRGEPRMEGRSDLQAVEGQLHRPAIREMPAGPDGDGAGGRLRDGAPARHGSTRREAVDADGVCGPRGPRSAEQRPRKSQALPDQRGPQEGRAWPLCPGCGKPAVAAGLNTSLKPAHEPILLARKPLAGTVAANVLAHRTGAINIDACRVGTGEALAGSSRQHNIRGGNYASATDSPAEVADGFTQHAAGRWPTNVVLAHHPDCQDTGETRAVKTGTAVNRNRDGRAPSTVGYASSNVDPADITYGTNGTEQVPVFECAPGCQVAALDEQSGALTSGTKTTVGEQRDDRVGYRMPGGLGYGDSGGASRFFPTFRYGPGDLHCHPDCQVAALDEQSGNRPSGGSTHERSTRRQEVFGQYTPGRNIERGADSGGASRFFPTFRYQAKAPKTERPIVDGQSHPTVKPLGLMRWLVRLLVPGEVDYPDGSGTCGAVLDPFAGSGATLEAARLEGRRAVGVERDEHSVRLIAQRLGVDCRIPDEAPASLEAPDAFDALIAAVLNTGSLEELDVLRRFPGWAPEHEALAALRAHDLEGAAA